MAINLLELPTLAEVVKDSDYLHIRSTVTDGPNAGNSLDFRVTRGTLFSNYVTTSAINNNIGGLVALVDNAGVPTLPNVSGALLTNLTLPTATGSIRGGVILLDSTTSTSGVGGGLAATPLSVRTVDVRVSSLTASQIANVASGSIAATNVQTALNELGTEKLDAAAGVAYDSARLGGIVASSYLRASVATASQIVNTPAGSISATNVQTALNELDTEKLNAATGIAYDAARLGTYLANTYLRSGVATAANIVNVAAGNIAATTVQAALNELDTEKLAISAATATNIVNTPAGTIAATTVQAALNELDTEKLSSASGIAYDSARLGTYLANTYLRSGAATATDIVNTPAGNIAATTVQAALAELDAEKLSTSGTAANSTLLNGIAASSYLRSGVATASQIVNTPAGNIAATTVQAALAELDAEKLAVSGTAANSTLFAGRPLGDFLLTTGTPASGIVVTPVGGISSTDLQSAIAELDIEKLSTSGTAANSTLLNGIAASSYLRSGVATASQVVNTPAGNIAATTVQAALAELDAEKLSVATAQSDYLRSSISTASQLVNTPAGNIAATTVQAALNELDTEKLSTSGTAANSTLLNGIAASSYLRSGVATAANIVNVAAGNIAATTVQAALNELDTEKLAISAATAANIVNTPAGTIAATTVQAALNELDTEKLSTSGTAANSSQLGGIAAASYLRASVATASQIVNTPAGNIAATTVQAALAELDSEKLAVSAATAANIVNTPAGTIAATTVQAALNELDTEKLSSASGVAYDSARLGGVLASNYLQSGAIPASGVTFVAYPVGGVGSTTVQAAIQELADEKLSNTHIDIYEAGVSSDHRVSIGVGAQDSLPSVGTVAIGGFAGSNSQGAGSVAVGRNAGSSTQGSNSVAVGDNAGISSQGTGSIAIGRDAGNSTQGTNCVAVGRDSGLITQGASSVAVGYRAGRTNQGTQSIAIGESAGANWSASSYQMDYSVAIGANAYTASSTIGLDGYATAVGYAANASGVGAVALGRDSEASDINCFAVGQDSTASALSAISVGAGSTASGLGGVSVGVNSLSTSSGIASSVAVGNAASANGDGAVAVGPATVAGPSSVALGNLATTQTAASSVAIGNGAYGTGGSATAVGRDSRAQAAYSTAIGAASGSSNTTYTNSTSVGYQATVTGPNQMQFGNSAVVMYSYNPSIQNRSDARDKANVKDTELGLTFISALRPVQYQLDFRDDYREDRDTPLNDVVKDGSKVRSRFHNGFIAQELEQTCKDMGVDFAGLQNTSYDGLGEDVYSIGYTELIAPMIKAIQELSAQVTDLKKQLEDKPLTKKVK